MHMSDAILSPQVGITFWGISSAWLVWSSKKITSSRQNNYALMGVISAFVFAAQMINFSIPGTGASGHFIGAVLLVAILGPWRGFIAMSSILTIQCFFFADGGVLALGSNIFNLAFPVSFIVYPLIWKPFSQYLSSRKNLMILSIVASVLSLGIGAGSLVLQASLSGFLEVPWKTFASVMLPIHLLIGVFEGFITGSVLILLKKHDIVNIENFNTSNDFSINGLWKPVMVTVFLAAFVSSFSSIKPDGLEWALASIDFSSSSASFFSHFHGIFPDYGFASVPSVLSGIESESSTISWERSIAGITGITLVLLFSVILGKILRPFSITKTKHKEFI